MAYQPLATFDFSKLFVPIDQVEGLQKISDKAKKTGESLVAKGKQMTADYVKKETAYLNKPMTTQNVADMTMGFVGGGMKNVGNEVAKGVIKVAKPLFTKAVDAIAPKIKGSKEFVSYAEDVYKEFGLKKKSILESAQSVDPNITDVKLGGSYGKGTPNEGSDIDLEFSYKGKPPEKLYEKLAGQFSIGGGMADAGVVQGKTNLKTLVGGTIVTGAVAANEALSKSEYSKPETQMFVKSPALDREDFTNRIVNVENEQAVATSTDPYPIIGHTGDLGKYQVNPASLKDWSKHWLGKTMTPQEFLKDPKAQDKFFHEFLNVVDKYKLTPDEAAVAWHSGWGKLGTNLVDKEKRFRDYLRNAMQTPENKRYLELFNKMK